MRARQLIGGAAFPPETLNVIFQAFDDAWGELGPALGAEPGAVEAAKLSLATIVLSIANAGPIERASLRDAAVSAFRLKHRVT
jgi:hypothetical protein